MIVNRSFAKIVSVLFFFEFAFLFAGVIIYFIPGFSFSENPIIRFAGLIFCIFITAIFYAFISEDEEIINENDKGNFLIKEKIEYGRLIPILIVLGIFIAVIAKIIINSL